MATPNDDAQTYIRIYAGADGETHVDSNMAPGQTPSAMIIAALALMEHQDGHYLDRADFLQICQTLWDYHQARKDGNPE